MPVEGVELFVNGGVWPSLLVLLTGNAGTDAVLPVGEGESLCPLGLLVGVTEVAVGEP